MKSLKKHFLCIVLAFVLTLCSLCVPAAASFDAYETAGEAMEVLRTLDVIPDYYDYNIDYSTYITRADFADAVYKIIYSGNYKSSAVYYYDVPPTHWAYEAIGYLTEAGLVCGTEDKKFNPDDYIKPEEAYKILLTLMGYREYCENNGGFPSGYLKGARVSKIDGDVSSSEYVTKGDMFIILYNAAAANVLEPDSYGSDTVSYRLSKSETILSQYRSIYYETGILTAANCASITEFDAPERDKVIIDGVEYCVNDSIADYLGEEVRFLYKYDPISEKKTIIWLKKTGGTSCLKINADNDAYFDPLSFTLTYNNGGNNSKKVTLSKSVAVVYNGELVRSNLSQIFSLPRYSLKLVKGGGGSYDTAIVWAYENIVVGNISSANMVVYDKIDTSKSVILDSDKYEFFNMTASGGYEAEFSDLTDGNVISVYKSLQGNSLTAVISFETVTGTVSSIRHDSYGDYYEIEGVEYYRPSNTYSSSVKAGDSVTLCLDANKHIAYETVSIGSGFAAFVIDAAVQGVIDKTCKIKYLGQDGKITVSECNSSVKIDGTPCKTSEDIYANLSDNGEFLPQLVILALDAEGKIISVDTSERDTLKEGSNTLQINIPYTAECIYKSSYGILGLKSVINDSTILFSVPDISAMSDAEDENFYIIKKTDLENDEILKCETYKTEDGDGYEQFVVIYGRSKGLEIKAPVLVRGIEEILDSEGNSVDCIAGMRGSAEVKLPVDESIADVVRNDIHGGCLIQTGVNHDGKVNEYKIWYDPDNPSRYSSYPAADSSCNAKYRSVIGYVNSVVGSVMYIGKDDVKDQRDQAIRLSGVPVLMYHGADARIPIEICSAADAKSYVNYGDDCTRVAVITSYIAPLAIIFYEQ